MIKIIFKFSFLVLVFFLFFGKVSLVQAIVPTVKGTVTAGGVPLAWTWVEWKNCAGKLRYAITNDQGEFNFYSQDYLYKNHPSSVLECNLDQSWYKQLPNPQGNINWDPKNKSRDFMILYTAKGIPDGNAIFGWNNNLGNFGCWWNMHYLQVITNDHECPEVKITSENVGNISEDNKARNDCIEGQYVPDGLSNVAGEIVIDIECGGGCEPEAPCEPDTPGSSLSSDCAGMSCIDGGCVCEPNSCVPGETECTCGDGVYCSGDQCGGYGFCEGGVCQTCDPAEPTVTPIPTVTPTPTPAQIEEDLTQDDSDEMVQSIQDITKKDDQRIVCLDTYKCVDPSSNCEVNDEYLFHSVKLGTKEIAKKLEFGVGIIVECVHSSSGMLCNSGNLEKDYADIIGIPNSDSFGEAGIGYEFLGFYDEAGNSLSSTLVEVPSDGVIANYHWSSTTTEYLPRTFFIIQDYDLEVEVNSLSGEGASQQQGNISMDIPDDVNVICTAIYWDPYGRVFDSYTLEPLNGVEVTLYGKRDINKYSKVSSRFDFVPDHFKNPLFTKEDGKFNFDVVDGIYKLDADLVGYRFPGVPDNLNENYQDYYSDIYRGEDIYEFGKHEHRDIPLDPKDLRASEDYMRNNPVKIISISQSADYDIKIYSIEGVVSHPRAVVEVYGLKDSDNLLAKVEANKDGVFNVKVDYSEFADGDYIGRVVVKKRKVALEDDNLLSFLDDLNIFKRVDADYDGIDSIEINPILDEVKGYVKDDNGQIIKNAKVEVITSMTGQSYATTNSGDTGYIKISKQYLPNVEYKLRYTTKDGLVIEKEMANFIKEN